MTDDAPAAAPTGSRLRTALPFVLTLVAALVAVSIVLLRGMDGPLVLENDGIGGTAPGAVGKVYSATVRVAMPEGKPATIKAVRTKVDPGFEVIDAYVWRQGSSTSGSPALVRWPLTGAAKPEPRSLKQPGNFEMSTGRAEPATSTLISIVVRPTREGFHSLRKVEIDYTRGLRRHRKTYELGFRICANPRGTAAPTIDFCREPAAASTE